MKVRNRRTGIVVEATKKEDGSYSCEGAVFTKEEMGSSYEIVKEKPKVEAIEVPAGFAPPKVNLVGDDLSGIFKAIAKASGQMTNLNKGKEAFNYKYMTLGQVIDMTRKPLADEELSIQNYPSSYYIGKQLMARVELIVGHGSGAYISSVFDVPVNPTPKQIVIQAIATAQSYCVRYHRVNLLGIAGEDDTDGK